MDRVYSVNGVPIRLTQERWEHIVSNKPYMETYYERVLDAVERPTWVLQGYAGALAAVLTLGKQGYLHVVYRELNRTDGFIITAFIAREGEQKSNRMAKEALARKVWDIYSKPSPTSCNYQSIGCGWTMMRRLMCCMSISLTR